MSAVNAANPDNGSPIRVVITPSQSSFFAGEQFSAVITFTNTRTPDAVPSKPLTHRPTHAYTHKRGAHSISSAPLARPPTSPGTPRMPIPPPRASEALDIALPRRKGLVGIDKKVSVDGQLPELLGHGRKKLLGKSQSVSLSQQELQDQLAEGSPALTPLASSSAKPVFTESSQSPPLSPRTPSPLTRTGTLSLSSDHPHARKQSILDGQLSLDVLSPTTSVPPQPYTPNASLSLGTISESTLPAISSPSQPSTPRISSPLVPPHSRTGGVPVTSSTNTNTVQAYPSVVLDAPPHPHHPTRFSQQAQIGLGHPSSPHQHSFREQHGKVPRTAFSSSFPQNDTELILYSYAQLIGTAYVIPENVPGGIAPSQEQLQRMNRVRRALVKKKAVVGGGSMDITQTLQGMPSPSSSAYAHRQQQQHAGMYGGGGGGTRKRPGHARSTSFSAGLMSLLSPVVSSPSSDSPSFGFSSGSTMEQANGSAMTPTSLSPRSRLGSPASLGGMPAVDEEDIDPELPLPTFEAQPSMIAVDMSLLPGETKSYTYTIKLPDVLPPTYKGRALRFSYELVVGTCRAGSSGSAGLNSTSRVMKVPIRVYNHVTVNRPPKHYDLLWPVLHGRHLGSAGKLREKEIPEAQGKVVEETGAMIAKLRNVVHLSLPKSNSEGSLEELKQYTRRLLASLPPSVVTNGNDSADSESPSPALTVNGDTGDTSNAGSKINLEEVRELEEEEDQGPLGCREAVEILTRTPKKASYDVNKDGIKVAVLTFTKSAYRLGETVTGIVELNDRTERTRVLRLSAVLEAHETLPNAILPSSSARHLKRAYAEHYSSFTLDTLRTAFSLDIPSDASPAFQVRINDEDVSVPLAVWMGGLEWKVRLCLLVAVAAESSDCGTEGVYFKSLERDGVRGEWGSSWRAPKGLAPLERSRGGLELMQEGREKVKTQSWTQFFVDSMWSTIGGGGGGNGHAQEGTREEDYGDGDEAESEKEYDGIKADLAGGVGRGVDFGGGEEGWREVRVETVECEVPIRVWPGNTAFRAVDVVFDV